MLSCLALPHIKHSLPMYATLSLFLCWFFTAQHFIMYNIIAKPYLTKCLIFSDFPTGVSIFHVPILIQLSRTCFFTIPLHENVGTLTYFCLLHQSNKINKFYPAT